MLLLSGLSIACNLDEFNVFDPPSGQTCFQWAGEFVAAAGGYLDNPQDQSGCRYCQYQVSVVRTHLKPYYSLSVLQTGDQYFEPLNIKYSNRWRDAWILFCYFIFNIFATIREYLPPYPLRIFSSDVQLHHDYCVTRSVKVFVYVLKSIPAADALCNSHLPVSYVSIPRSPYRYLDTFIVDRSVDARLPVNSAILIISNHYILQYTIERHSFVLSKSLTL